MKVSILCSDLGHPVVPHLHRWIEAHPQLEIELCQKKVELTGGSLLFLISCSEMIRQDTKDLYEHTLVIHASNVPNGRGFAPLNWQILEGAKIITVTMMDAAMKVDTGEIYHQVTFENEGFETFDEIFEKLFEAEIELMNYAVANYPNLPRRPQPTDVEDSYYRRRTAEDSKVLASQSLEEIFDLLRASDPIRYPVTFEHRGHRYRLAIERIDVREEE